MARRGRVHVLAVRGPHEVHVSVCHVVHVSQCHVVSHVAQIPPVIQIALSMSSMMSTLKRSSDSSHLPIEFTSVSMARPPIELTRDSMRRAQIHPAAPKVDVLMLSPVSLPSARSARCEYLYISGNNICYPDNCGSSHVQPGLY